MSSVAPLSYNTIKAWMEMMDIHYIAPYEIEALIILDGALFIVDSPEANEDTKVDADNPAVYIDWPDKKKKI